MKRIGWELDSYVYRRTGALKWNVQGVWGLDRGIGTE